MPVGYGNAFIGPGVWAGAHRVAYELIVGPIPEGLDLDHTCGNKSCVNPDHLDPVTRAEHMRRELARRGRIVACKYGHELNALTTRFIKHGDHMERICSQCSINRKRRFNARKRDERICRLASTSNS